MNHIPNRRHIRPKDGTSDWFVGIGRFLVMADKDNAASLSVAVFNGYPGSEWNRAVATFFGRYGKRAEFFW
jgi:hypothetical protein